MQIREANDRLFHRCYSVPDVHQKDPIKKSRSFAYGSVDERQYIRLYLLSDSKILICINIDIMQVLHIISGVIADTFC